MTDRDRLIELLDDIDRTYDCFRIRTSAIADCLLANCVVKVVRCKDCAVPHNKWLGCPKMNGLIPPPNHFCSYGELKECEGK